jgi:indolepyruvate ferredoxin oxidoreductase, beta subunit
MIDEYNISIVGVGGQGVILMSELLGNAAIQDGLNVKGSEILGMAVRGGSVSSMIRIGRDVYGPLIPTGKCDVLVGMEPAEALRNISYLNRSSTVVLNMESVIPFTVSLGASKYPDIEDIIEKLSQAAGRVITLNASRIAREASNQQAANVVMLGALFGTGGIPINENTIKKEIEARIPARLVTVNLKAFDLGKKTINDQSG